MSSPEGFLNSMAGKGVSNGHYLMNFTYVQTGGVPSKVYPCNQIFDKVDDQGRTVDPSGYPIYLDQGTLKKN